MQDLRARNFHSYTRLIPALGIVREPTVRWFITSQYPGIHDMAGLVLGTKTLRNPVGTLTKVIALTYHVLMSLDFLHVESIYDIVRKRSRAPRIRRIGPRCGPQRPASP